MSDIQKGLERDARIIKERILMGTIAEKEKHAVESLKHFLKDQNWTQTAVANKLGVSNAVINQFLQGKYAGKTEDLINKIIHLIDSIARKKRRPRNDAFIETVVAKKISTLITQTEAFSDEEGKIGLIIGDGGHGKSRCMKEFAKANKNTVYVELDEGMNSMLIFSEIAEKMGIYSAGSLATVTRRLIDELQNRHIIIMLDEASHLRIKQLNLLRQIIVVKSRCPLILAGNRYLLNTIMQISTKRGYESLDQFTSRLMSILDLDAISSSKDGGLYTVEDIRKLYEYGGFRLTSDAVKTLRKICQTPQTGRLRICADIISALHTSARVIEAEQIDSDDIRDAITDLRLPVRARLPLAVPDRMDEQQAEAAAAG